MTTLIAEDLVLLLLDDDSGKLKHADYLDIGIGGALLVELALGGYVEMVRGDGHWARAKVRAADVPPPSEALLSESLGLVAAKERPAQDLVVRLGRKRRRQLLDRLCERGMVRADHVKVLGLVPRPRWPTADGTHEADVRRALGDALVRDAVAGANAAIAAVVVAGVVTAGQ